MAIDSTTLQVLANCCAAAAEARAYTVMRTAHSTCVKETVGFTYMLCTLDLAGAARAVSRVRHGLRASGRIAKGDA